MLHRFKTFETKEYGFVLAAENRLKELEELCQEHGIEISETNINKAHDEISVTLTNGLKISAKEDHATQGQTWDYGLKMFSSWITKYKITDPIKVVQATKNYLSNK